MDPVIVAIPADDTVEKSDKSSPAVATRPATATPPGQRIFKKESTLGTGKDKAGVKFADAKPGGKIAVSVYVENLYYLTSSRYVAAQEAAAAAADNNQPGGCCTIS